MLFLFRGGTKMSTCNIDHSHEDVRKKYEAQSEFLPNGIRDLFAAFFQKEHSQEILNEVFHLLKKYDLADEEEKEERNRRLEFILKNIS
jgi:citrate synthase